MVKGNQSITTTLVVYALGLAVGYLTGFLATYFFGFSRQMRTDLNHDTHDSDTPRNPGTTTPAAGTPPAPAPSGTPTHPEGVHIPG